MDNADLEKLSISPGKLTPKFHPNTTEYSVTLGSDVKQIKVDPLTSDSGASYSISGGGGGKTVPLKEGEVTLVKIEVTAEDGSTIKNYFIRVTRLSASDASLIGLNLSVPCLHSPEFASNVLSYTACVSYSCSSIEITAVVADKKTAVKVNGGDPKSPVAINYGETAIDVQVTSPDESKTQSYFLTVSRLKLPRPVKFVDENEGEKFGCPVCLGVLHRPKSIKDSEPKHVFCKSCIDELTRTSKQDPLDGSPLEGEWRIDEYDLDKELSAKLVCCVYSHWGCDEKVKLCDLGAHMKECTFRPAVVEKSGEMVPAKDLVEKSKDACKPCPECNRPVRTADLEDHKSYICTSNHANTAVKHKAEVRGWEKKLQQETSEKSADKLVSTAEEQVKLSFSVLPQHGNAGHYSGEVSPLRYLEFAAEGLATAIKLSPKKAELHFKLAQILEEQHYVQDVYGIKPLSSDDEEMDFNMKSKESSKEDDIQAICEMRGAGRNAPLSLQLKAIDEEYHYLLDQGQSDKADYVQKLYAWKSKQATQNKTAQLATNEEEPLGKAYLKYLDALSNSPDSHLYNLHVGRMLLLQSKPDEAVPRLQVAVGIKPTNVDARFYLGLALCQQKDGPGKRKKEAVKYLSEGLEYHINKLTTNADDPAKDHFKTQQTILSSENLLRSDNVQLLQGLTCLGNLCTKLLTPPSGVMPAGTAFLTATMLASEVLTQLVARGNTYHQVEWVLFEAHSSLLQRMLSADKNQGGGKDKVVSRHCENLSGLIKCSTIPPGKQLLQLQEKTCQQAVLLQPCNSRALYRLGDAQLSCYDNDPASTAGTQILDEAELSYRAAIELEGSASESGVAPAKLGQQQWFKQRQAKKEAVRAGPGSGGALQKAAGAPAGKGASPAGRGRTTAGRGRGGPAARGGAAGRGGAASSRGGSTSVAKPAGGTRGRNSPTKPAVGRGAARGGSTSTASKTSASSVKLSSSTTSAHKSGACAPTKQPSPSKAQAAPPTAPEKPQAPSPPADSKPSGLPNKPSYQARLGLARVLMRKGGDGISEAHQLYEQVIFMAPTVHDAYIELADSLVKSDPMKAVDIYVKYPFEEPLTFDDAYIHGEIVRLLMKNEKYDDQRLGPSMISLGRVMGLTVLEKYVETLDKTFKYSKLLKEIYAGVHGKKVDDPDLQQFFKFKCWV